MDYIKNLEKLLKEDVLLEVNENIKEIKESLEKKKDKALKEELDYMNEVKKYFDEVLLDIEQKTITQEEALDILEGLEDMRADNQEV
jgi:predicted RNA-binding protein with EMAP domain